MPLLNIIPVTNENIHEMIPNFIDHHKIMIVTYEDMMEVVLHMIREKYLFIMERDILRECIVDLTYMYSPGDDINKDRIVSILDPDESDDSDNEDDSDPPPSIQ